MSRKSGSVQTELALFFAILLLSFSALAQPPSATEDQVKAAFLFNFAKLGEWPAQVLPTGAAPFLIGISGGNDEFINILRTIVSGKASGTHALIIKAVNSEDDMKACQMVFFRGSGKKPSPANLQELANASVLLVGEDSAFLDDGGMINLIREHASIRFEISSQALDLSRIHLSPKILALAKAPAGSTSTASASPAGEERRLESSPPPQYPAIAKQMNLTGTARVQARVMANGTVAEVTVLGGHPLLAAALADAVHQWKYQPAPKETVEVVKFNFGPL